MATGIDCDKETDVMVTLPVIGQLTYREWHEWINGFYSGARWGITVGNDHQHEYWRCGYLLGTLCRYTLTTLIYTHLRKEDT